MPTHRDTNAEIDEWVRLAGGFFEPDSFARPLAEAQAETLVTLHGLVASRYGSRAASRAVARLGGVPALQQLLRAMHKRKIAGSAQAKLLAEIDAMLKNSDEVDRARGSTDNDRGDRAL